ncbi:hypothetical protein Tco_0216212 [Tanacetum coccineum]
MASQCIRKEGVEQYHLKTRYESSNANKNMEINEVKETHGLQTIDTKHHTKTDHQKRILLMPTTGVSGEQDKQKICSTKDNKVHSVLLGGQFSLTHWATVEVT